MLLKINNRCFSSLLLALTTFSIAAQAATPALIPLDDRLSPPAADLALPGSNFPIPVPAAQKLRDAGNDLSLYNPVESDIWKNTTPSSVTSPILVPDNNTVSYDSTKSSLAGNFRFVAFSKTATGNKAYEFYVSREAHDLLLRRALLIKLGYQVQPAHRLGKVTVKFRTRIEAEGFLQKMTSATFVSSLQDRWLVSKSPDGTQITLQDVVVTVADLQSYNLAVGFVPSNIIQGRRAMNALLVPYSFVYVPESVNLFSWRAGTIINQSVNLDAENSDQFYSSFADAAWISKRLLALTRADFNQIVAAADLPAPVAQLLLEKMISRRNSLRTLLNLAGSDLSFDSSPNSGNLLVNGQLTQEKWDGYGSHFSHGDPESPLSASNLWAYVQSQGLSMALETAMGVLNNYTVFPDVQTELAKKQMDRLNQSLSDLAKTGQTQVTTFGLDAVPFGGANLILSRDIVTGNYMGSDQLVQLADSIGIGLNAGVALAPYGLPNGVSVEGQATAFLNRTYSHLKPVTSVTAALHTPFRQMLIPLIKHEYGSALDDLVAKPDDYFKTDDGKKRLSQIIGTLKDALQVKESLVVTDSIGGGLGGGVTYNILSDWIDAKAKFMANQLVLSRLQIYRASEDEIQIYKDDGNLRNFGLKVSLNAIAPLISAGTTFSYASVGTKYYRLNINEDLDKNPDLLKNLQSVRSVLMSNSLEAINQNQKPIRLQHDVRDVADDLSLLVWRWRWENTRDIITVTAPAGAQKTFIRQMTGKRNGDDFQDFALDVASGLLQHYVSKDLDLSRVGSTDPGTTVEGSSKRRVITYEAEIAGWDGRSQGTTINDFVRVERHWKGWRADRDDVTDMVQEINNRAGKILFPTPALQETQSVDLYDLALMVHVYDKGIAHLAALSSDQLAALIRKYMSGGSNPWAVMALSNAQSDLADAIRKKDPKKIALAKVTMVDAVEGTLSLTGLAEAVGGLDNIYIYGMMSGFRNGPEDGDQPLVSDTLGHIGSAQSQGPLTGIQNQLGMTDTEFLAYWLFDRM